MNRSAITFILFVSFLIGGCQQKKTDFNIEGIRDGVFPSATAAKYSIVKINKEHEKIQLLSTPAFGGGAFDVMKDPLNAPFLKMDRDLADYSYYAGQVVSITSDSVVVRHTIKAPLISGGSLTNKDFKPSDNDNFYENYYEKSSSASASMPIFGLNISEDQKAIFSVDRVAEYNAADLLDIDQLQKIKQAILDAKLDPKNYYVVMGITVFLYKAEIYQSGKAGGNVTVPMYCIKGDYFQGTGTKKRVYRAQLSIAPLTEVF
jgi:hypothetical protein